MSGASGVVPAAIHLSPEAVGGGPLCRLRDGDILRLDARDGVLEARVPAETWTAREPWIPDVSGRREGTGRELFGLFRMHATDAESGARSCQP
jgi:phosphogluconate dehydratase